MCQLVNVSYQGTYESQIQMADWKNRDFGLYSLLASARVSAPMGL